MTQTRRDAARFVILFEGRTGSSYLIDCLDSHPSITAKGEILDELVAYRDALDGRAQALGLQEKTGLVLPVHERAAQQQLQRTMDLLMGPAEPGRFAVGFKTKLRSVLAPAAFGELLRALGVRVIHMVRRNVIKQVVSSFNAARLYESTGRWNLYRSRDALPPFAIDPHRFEEVLSDRERAERELADYVESLRRPSPSGAAGLDVLTVPYEDILRSPLRVHETLQSYLGVPVRKLSGAVLKNTDDDLRNVVENFEELRARYEGSGYAPMFDEILAGRDRDALKPGESIV